MSELVIEVFLAMDNGQGIAILDCGECIPGRTCVITGHWQVLIWIAHRRSVFPAVWMRVGWQVQGNGWSYLVTPLTDPQQPLGSATESAAFHQNT